MSSPSCSRLCSLLFMLLFILPTAFTFSKEDCQTTPASLVAQKEYPKWMSPSGEFALGFHPTDNKKHFLLAIWFNKVEDRRIVWSANGNEAAPLSSEFKLSSNGQFLLSDPNGKELWRAQTNGTKSAWAVILDCGNFMILDENYNPIWESFREPTDTILPGQILYMPTFLKARRSETDYADGDFQLRLQDDVNLVFYHVPSPDENVIRAYWATMTVYWNSQLIFDKAGHIYIKDEGTLMVHNITQDEISNQMFYYMARIDVDGVFRLYKHLKREDVTNDGSCTLSWTTVQEIPDDICLTAPTHGNGRGWCGYNSICEKKNDRISLYSCPIKYSLNASDPEKGCKPDFPLPTCEVDGWETNKEFVKFEELIHTTWRFSDYNYHSGVEINKSRCQQLCLDDCFCAEITYHDSKFWMKRHLVNGVKSLTIEETGFLKVPMREVKNKKDQSTLVLVLAILLGSSGFLNILLLVAVLLALLFANHKMRNFVDTASTSTMSIRRYTYKELEKATGGFEQILGRGASGKVYKGVLALDPKRFVAIKMLEGVAEEGEYSSSLNLSHERKVYNHSHRIHGTYTISASLLHWRCKHS